MRLAPLIRLLLVGLLGLTSLRAWPAEARTEDEKIEALLAYVAGQKDVQFVRNGSTYESATAVKFLRGKWDKQKADVKTVDDFIAKVASKSSTTGLPYRIRFKDGHEIDCADFLRARLVEPVAK